MRDRLNKIKEAAAARDPEYYARWWLKNVFHALLKDALIDGETSVTIGTMGPSDVRDEEKKLLADLGYSVRQFTKYDIAGGSETTTVISWKNE